jgi:hypothetical protein
VLVDNQRKRPGRNVEDDLIPISNTGDGSTRDRLRGDVTGHQAVCSSGKATVGKQSD